jgi:DNA-binding protein HU-beta
MNKADLIDNIATATDISKAVAGKVLDSVIDVITSALSKGDMVTLIGFGTFVVRERSARTGRNPRTGQTIQIKGGRVPGFKAGKALKDAVSEGKA